MNVLDKLQQDQHSSHVSIKILETQHMPQATLPMTELRFKPRGSPDVETGALSSKRHNLARRSQNHDWQPMSEKGINVKFSRSKDIRDYTWVGFTKLGLGRGKGAFFLLKEAEGFPNGDSRAHCPDGMRAPRGRTRAPRAVPGPEQELNKHVLNDWTRNKPTHSNIYWTLTRGQAQRM